MSLHKPEEEPARSDIAPTTSVNKKTKSFAKQTGLILLYRVSLCLAPAEPRLIFSGYLQQHKQELLLEPQTKDAFLHPCVLFKCLCHSTFVPPTLSHILSRCKTETNKLYYLLRQIISEFVISEGGKLQITQNGIIIYSSVTYSKVAPRSSSHCVTSCQGKLVWGERSYSSPIEG